MSEWHLPVPDPNNQGKYMYRLHTVDIYLWTQSDAGMFLDSLRRVMQPHQLHITADPQAVTPTSAHHEHKSDTMSPVIANLERAAISHQSRTPSISTTQAFPGPPQAFPGPPSGRASTASPPGEQGFAPMAYNPAAPAAPEPIAHREKTPPPPMLQKEPASSELLCMTHSLSNTAIPYRLLSPSTNLGTIQAWATGTRSRL